MSEKNSRKYLKKKSIRHKNRKPTKKTKKKQRTSNRFVASTLSSNLNGGGYTGDLLFLLDKFIEKIKKPNSNINNDDIKTLKNVADTVAKHYADDTYKIKKSINDTEIVNYNSPCNINDTKYKLTEPAQIIKNNIKNLDLDIFYKLITSLIDLIRHRNAYKCIQSKIPHNDDRFRNIRVFFKDLGGEERKLLYNMAVITNIYKTALRDIQNEQNNKNEVKPNNNDRRKFDKETIDKIVKTIFNDPIVRDSDKENVNTEYNYSDNMVWLWYYYNKEYYNKDYETMVTNDSFLNDTELKMLASTFCEKNEPIQDIPTPTSKPIMNETIKNAIKKIDLTQDVSTCADRYITFLWYMYNYAYETNSYYKNGEWILPETTVTNSIASQQNLLNSVEASTGATKDHVIEYKAPVKNNSLFNLRGILGKT
jgi:hypothetical protein